VNHAFRARANGRKEYKTNRGHYSRKRLPVVIGNNSRMRDVEKLTGKKPKQARNVSAYYKTF